MNGKLVLLIVFIIVVAHSVVIYMFVRGGEPKKAAATAAHEAVQQQQQQQQPKEPPKPLHENPNFGKPFNYTGAINGDIGSLPDSKNATSGILVDLGTRQVLWAKNPKQAFPIASMTKMMTLLVAYEDVLSARGGITLDTVIPVTHTAMKIGGSQVYLDPKESFPLRELLKVISIKSANDAAYLVAEYVGGGDAASFVSRMNAKAREIGMTNTKFNNPHGLPEPSSSLDNAASPEDMAVLSEHSLEHRQLTEWSSTWRTDFRDKGVKGHLDITNHNHLVPGSPEACPGVDGMKTGFINRSGFCITVTCKRGDRRLVAVVTGFPTRKGRDEFMKKLLAWGYARAENPSAPEPQAPAAKQATKASASKASTTKKSSKK